MFLGRSRRNRGELEGYSLRANTFDGFPTPSDHTIIAAPISQVLHTPIEMAWQTSKLDNCFQNARRR